MEVDLETRECLESTDKSTSTGTAVFFLTLVFIAGCFIGVIVYSNMTSERGQREYKIWRASVENSRKAREKYCEAKECYLQELTPFGNCFNSRGKKKWLYGLYKLEDLDVTREKLAKVRDELISWVGSLSIKILGEDKQAMLERALAIMNSIDSKFILVSEAEREIKRAEEEECIARENLKILRGAVNQS